MESLKKKLCLSRSYKQVFRAPKTPQLWVHLFGSPRCRNHKIYLFFIIYQVSQLVQSARASSPNSVEFTQSPLLA